MANKYHFNKETGRANICRAVNNCPLGADTPHFDNKQDAKNYVEKEAKDNNKAFNSLSKKKPNTFQEKLGSEKSGISLEELKVIQDDMIKNSEAIIKHAEASDKVPNSTMFKDSVYLATTMLDNVTDEIQKREAKENKLNETFKNNSYEARSGAFNNLSKTSNKKINESIYNNEELIGEHSNPSYVNDYISDFPKENIRKNGIDVHYSLYSGKLNPARNLGSGSEYFEPGENSLVILSEANGKGARAISSYGDFYQYPEDHLGEPVIQSKQQLNSQDTEKPLNVVGYIGTDGKPYGYIPDKQVSFFVYK